VFYIGCPMWASKAWVGNFFPAHTPATDFLCLYSRKLNAVEGNTVFYALPSSETITRWKQETPETFRFCPKVSRSISHASSLENSREETRQLVERMQGLGTLFLQLPPSFGITKLAQLEAFLHEWPAEVRLAVEVRHPSFYTEHHALTLNTLLRRYNVGRVMMETRPISIGTAEEKQILHARERKPDLPLHIAVTTDFVFLRYIGHPRMEVNDPLLDTWPQQIGQWLKQGTTVYIFCHCPYEKHSPEICAALYQRVSTQVPLPPLISQQETNDTDLQQQRLF
jgi:uncharacterized protein YecE (DUF72 family)